MDIKNMKNEWDYLFLEDWRWSPWDIKKWILAPWDLQEYDKGGPLEYEEGTIEPFDYKGGGNGLLRNEGGSMDPLLFHVRAEIKRELSKILKEKPVSGSSQCVANIWIFEYI